MQHAGKKNGNKCLPEYPHVHEHPCTKQMPYRNHRPMLHTAHSEMLKGDNKATPSTLGRAKSMDIQARPPGIVGWHILQRWL